MDFDKKLQSIENFLKNTPKETLQINGLKGSSSAWLLSRCLNSLQGPLLWITEDSKKAQEVLNDFSFFSRINTYLYPGHDSLPFVHALPSPEIIAGKLALLYRLSTQREPVVIIAPVQAVFDLTIPSSILLDNVEYIEAGEESDREKLISWLAMTGYEHTALVQTRGEFSVRGGIVDLFPPSQEFPVRIDFFGDMVEAIRPFDPLTQRSMDDLEELIILPVSEILFFDKLLKKAQKDLIKKGDEKGWPAGRVSKLLHDFESHRFTEGQQALMPLFYEPASIFEHLPPNTFLVIENKLSIEGEIISHWEHAEKIYEIAAGEHCVMHRLGSIILEPAILKKEIGLRPAIFLEDAPGEVASTFFSGLDSKKQTIEFDIQPLDMPLPANLTNKAQEPLKYFFLKIKEWLSMGKKIIIAVPGNQHALRLSELFNEHGIRNEIVDDNVIFWSSSSAWGNCFLKIITGSISEGFFLKDEKFIIANEDELLGRSHLRSKVSKKTRTFVSDITFEDLKPDSLIVHKDHGVGLYHGLIQMALGEITGEFLHLEYRNGDKLYLPVDRLSLIQNYVGIEGREPGLDRLGGSTFALKKNKAKKAVYEIAHELVDLYAKRQLVKGFSFSSSGTIFREFEAAFPYEETQDQAKAIDEVLLDMEKDRPMDRLLCGDVGYGKTEVLMRAAMKALLNGKQTAVLVPTTLLAEQHERTFKKRFANLPVTIGAISRLKTRKEQKDFIKGISSGAIDIAIGTHRLLQSDIQFKDLGLLIIDEEHRFGVRQKERLKQLKQNIDCLALTATPIPRTLQLSMLGLRDLSVINTPPRDRLPVKTFISEFDKPLIKEAINRELKRGGQVFFVHNRIKGLFGLCEDLKRTVPEARFRAAHGQMDPSELEDIMIRFVRGEIDCLVSTTIIEAGIDIPSANTIIINRADTLGTADLYQLRGRVGRAHEQAYAFLLVSDINKINKDALKRLQAVMEMSFSGGGLRLAMHDLQLRGSGNILGIAQSGNIAEVGYDLFLDLIKDAVDDIKGQPREEIFDPEVNLGITAYIPQEYVPDMEQRLLIYRRIAGLKNHSESEELKIELKDRFGELPAAVQALFEVISIKRLLRSINCIMLNRTKNRDGSHNLVFSIKAGPVSAESLIQFIQKNTGVKLLPDGRLVMRRKAASLAVVEDTCKNLQKWLKKK